MNEIFDSSDRSEREGGKSTYSDANVTRFIRKPTYLALAHVDGLSVDGVRVVITKEVSDEFPRSALAVFNSQNGVIRNVTCQREKRPNAPPVVVLKDCQAIALEDQR